MDKKRRDQTTEIFLTNTEECKDFWRLQLQAVSKSDICGIRHFRYNFIPTFGNGFFEFYSFNGVYLSIIDFTLFDDLNLSGIRTDEVLEFSFLLEGEQIISLTHLKKDLIYEGPESYFRYIPKTAGNIKIPKGKRFKEIKIKLGANFIKNHSLDQEYDLQETFRLTTTDTITQPIPSKTQVLLTEILEDTRKGILKRLFLESKVLELLSLQLDVEKEISIDPTTVNTQTTKKIYQVQQIILANLSQQVSIQQLSKEVGINDFVVKKEFKRVFGQTIFEYALQQRMDHARKLLLHSKKPIYEISELVGYKNATHFSAAFKKIEGITPKKFRSEREAGIG
ncbi:AraC family transcriptional regulator [Aquimarina sp. ERC-38]|uniref:AraC family transcriptional regulator n=1 Tax=Aquimarina sp. ERC-38 TaxID=2949996 RepID=UPI00224801D5|nr:AraC family transcriptional regulator [Aquimarina sp. ERC-38]UZO80632.1 AraC family transcriptional regulator [Aquimarina sp. ERC-38]